MSHASPDLDRARALYEAGYLAEAARLYHGVLAQEPQHAEALWRLADVASRMGLHERALVLAQSSVVAAPHDKFAWNCLGTIHAASGNAKEAVKAFGRAITLAPDFALALANVGKLYVELGRVDEAVTAHRLCVRYDPARASHHVDLGQALLAAGDGEAALEAFGAALVLDPGAADARIGIGLAQSARGDMTASLDAFRQAVADHPGLFAAQHNLALALFRSGRLEEAVDAFRRAVAIDPGSAKAHTNLIFALDMDPRASLAEAMGERRRWHERHSAASRAVIRHTNDADPERRLRIGYVSGDLKMHSAVEALGPVILGHSQQFEVVCYSEVRKPDDVTKRFRTAAAAWRESWQMSDDALERCIREDRIDILVDLSGFTDGHRLSVFARKPAPVQVQGWGYPLGSGLPAMDYLMSDPILIPQEDRHLFAETVHDLPVFMPFAPPINSPPPAPPPAEINGYVTFGSMNRPAKINHDVLRVWAEILRRVPDARLLAKDAAFDGEDTRRWFRDSLVALGVAPDRIELRGRTTRREHLSAYKAVDIALDPFPQTGGITTFESLWMGVPVVTLLGRRPQGRVSASVLSTLGLAGDVARDEDEYVARAVAWATGGARPSAPRAELRERMRGSVLCDHAAYNAAVEAAYRDFWRRWCALQRNTASPAA
jgi:predicted O-linked N-acetylglucosamine transferase (SPINDLY family)